MIKFAPEGFPFIIGSLFLTIGVYLVTKNYYITLMPILLVLFMLFFFRDPERSIPADKGIFVAPADGKIIVVKDTFEHDHLKKNTKQISIFMSPFNVHVNRSPVNGSVVDVIHKKGSFLAAYKDAATEANEQTVMILDTEYGQILVRQVAGFIARRIVCRAKPGDILSRGERYGIIKFSSRVDVYLPESAETAVSVNDMVKAGETIVAKMRTAP